VVAAVLLIGGAIGGHFLDLFTLPFLPDRGYSGSYETRERDRDSDDDRGGGDDGEADDPSVLPSASSVDVELRHMGITNGQLAEMVANGEIPADVTHLDLSSNEISDITPLVGLRYLESLFLFDNMISDISMLSGFANLIKLDIGYTEVRDISQIAKLTNLIQLNLSGLGFRDISELSGLTFLEALYLTHNQVSDITPLRGLGNLETLILYGNQVSDITPLSELKNLSYLSLSENQINDISPITGLTNLKWLFLGGNPLPAQSVENLRMIFPNCQIDFAIEEMPDVEEPTPQSPVFTVIMPTEISEYIDTTLEPVDVWIASSYAAQNSLGWYDCSVMLHNLFAVTFDLGYYVMRQLPGGDFEPTDLGGILAENYTMVRNDKSEFDFTIPASYLSSGDLHVFIYLIGYY